jgi:hexosaminidase
VHPAWWSEDDKVQRFMRQQGLADVGALQAYFNRRVCQLVAQHGKKPVGWDEVLHKQMPNMLVQNWRGATTRDRVLAQQLDCVLSAGYYLDLFYPAELHYNYEPEADQAELVAFEDAMRADLRLAHVAQGIAWTDQWRSQTIEIDPEAQHLGKVIGGEACLWSEIVDEHTLETRLWSRLPAVAERLWSPREVKDVDQFYLRLQNVLGLPEFALVERQSKTLQQLGLQPQQIQAAMLLEPVKWYARLLGEQALQARLSGQEMPQARPYDVYTPLNRIIDHISPESLSARALAGLTPAELKEQALVWAQLDPATWPADAQPVITVLVDVGRQCFQLLAVDDADKQQVQGFIEYLRACYVPYGEYMLAVVPVLIDWLTRWNSVER